MKLSSFVTVASGFLSATRPELFVHAQRRAVAVPEGEADGAEAAERRGLADLEMSLDPLSMAATSDDEYLWARGYDNAPKDEGANVKNNQQLVYFSGGRAGHGSKRGSKKGRDPSTVSSTTAATTTTTTPAAISTAATSTTSRGGTTTATTSSQPVAAWKSGNTFPATGGQTTNMRAQGGGEFLNVVCGAVQSVLAHPSDANICFAGATNGGVWRTNSCTSAEPDWTPLTDKEASNSVGDMAFDGDDPRTLIVAIGTRSSFGQIGGPGIGLLLTDNALDSTPVWTNLDNGGIFRESNIKFNSVYMRGDLILASAYASNLASTPPETCNDRGIWRSTDRGVTWTNVLLGIGRAIAHDPNNLSRFYATLDYVQFCNGEPFQENGVFVSNDSGASWFPTSSQSEPLERGQLNNAKLSVSEDGSRLWSAILKDGQADSIAFSDDNGDSWTKMDEVRTEECDAQGNCTEVGLNPRVKPGSQGDKHFSLLASDTNKNEVYVGGDRQSFADTWPNSIGAKDSTGRLFRGDASIASTGDRIPSAQWDHMTDDDDVEDIPEGGTASGSAPHADSRDMKLRTDGAILEGDDGGIVVRTNPSSNTGDWFGVCGNTQVFEVHSLAYEPVFKSVLYGNQDTGTILGTLGIAGSFKTVVVADGGVAMIDYKSDPNFIFYYCSIQNAGNFVVQRKDKASGSVTDFFIPKQFEASFVPVTAMNPNDQTNFALGAGTDAPGSVMVYKVENLSSTPNFDRRETTPIFDNSFTPISAMAYSLDGKFLYAASTKDERGAVTRCSTDPTTEFIVACPVLANGVTPVGTVIKHMAVDPNDAGRVVGVAVREAYNVNDSKPQVFESVDGGSSWNDITVDNGPIDMAFNGHGVAFLSQERASFLVVGTSNGVYLRANESWELLADGLPTVPVWDMVYSSEDDRLIIATLGRGIWFLDDAFHVANIAQGGIVDFLPISVDVAENAGNSIDSFPAPSFKYPPDDFDEY